MLILLNSNFNFFTRQQDKNVRLDLKKKHETENNNKLIINISLRINNTGQLFKSEKNFYKRTRKDNCTWQTVP